MSRPYLKLLAASAAGLAPVAAAAHGPGEAEPSVDAWLLLAIGLPILVYTLGVMRVWRRAGVGRGARYGRIAAFVAGWAAAVLALASPLHALAERSFFGHMLVHNLLMLAAAPLLVLACPLAPLAWALPRPARTRLFRTAPARRLLASTRRLAGPVPATVLQAAVLSAWHLPRLFDVALRHRSVHSLQHLTFLAVSLLFWWAILEGRRDQDGVAALCLFATSLHGTLLGALLTVASAPWYTAQATGAAPFGLSPLEDQQLGGLVMWVPAGSVYAGIGLLLFGRWVRASSAAAWRPERVG